MGVGILRQNSQRVLRGGSWINNARNLRSANRNANSPDNRNDNIGLRLAGALLNCICHQANLKGGGSINQWFFLFIGEIDHHQRQNQDLQRVSKFIESLLIGRLIRLDCFTHEY